MKAKICTVAVVLMMPVLGFFAKVHLIPVPNIQPNLVLDTAMGVAVYLGVFGLALFVGLIYSFLNEVIFK